jgi:tight adherence protein B
MKGFIAAIACAAFAFVLTTYLQSRRAWRQATFIQRTNAMIDDQRKEAGRVSPLVRWRAFVASKGWAGSMVPLATVAGFLYLLVVSILVIAGFNSVLAALLALPACLVTARITLRVRDEQRRARFRSQLLVMMNLLAAQIESGSGVERALGQIVSQLENPLGEELERVLAETRASRNLVEALGDLAVRYPSRAMTMFVSALDIDQKVGGVLGPVLRQASALLEREFELAAEGRAEVSQTRSEFFILIAGITGLAFLMITRSGAQGAAAYGSTIGMILMTLAASNFLFGIYRVTRLLRKASGDQS